MKRLIIYSILALLMVNFSKAQTAYDFTLNDCNGTSRNLYSTLDQGKVVVLVYEMQCTGSLNGAKNITQVMNTWYSLNGAIEIMYLDNAGHDCASTTNWVSSNSLFPGTMFEYSNSYTSPYGSGMPVIVITAGTNHQTYLVANNASDTNTIHNAIKLALTSVAATQFAFNFSRTDCNGSMQSLYSYLDQNKVAVVLYEHQCGGCTSGATNVSTVMNTFYQAHPKIQLYYLDNGGHDCSSTVSWINTNSLYQGINFEYSSDNNSPYGPGMPVIVITAGPLHKTFLIAHNASDTNTIHLALRAALDELTASVPHHQKYDNNMSVLVNPVTNGKLLVSFATDPGNLLSAEIYNILGNRVKSYANGISASSSNLHEFSVIDIPSGIYFISMKTRTGNYVRKFIIQN